MKLTPKQVQEIRDLRRAGYTIVSIGEAYGISNVLVSYIMSGKVWGRLPDVPGLTPHYPELRRKRNARTNSKLSTAEVQQVRDLHRAGHTQTAIAARFGITPGTVGQIVKGQTWQQLPDRPGQAPTLPVQPTVSLRVRLRITTGGPRLRVRVRRDQHLLRIIARAPRAKVSKVPRPWPEPATVWQRLNVCLLRAQAGRRPRPVDEVTV